MTLDQLAPRQTDCDAAPRRARRRRRIIDHSLPYGELSLQSYLSFLNSVVKPVIVFFTIPISFFTLGLFLLVINAFMVMLADKLVDGFSVHSFWTALGFSIVLWIIYAMVFAYR